MGFLERGTTNCGTAAPSFPPVITPTSVLLLSCLRCCCCFCFLPPPVARRPSCFCLFFTTKLLLLVLLLPGDSCLQLGCPSSSAPAAPYLQISTLLTLTFPAQSFQPALFIFLIALRQYQAYCETLPFRRASLISTTQSRRNQLPCLPHSTTTLPLFARGPETAMAGQEPATSMMET